VEKGDRGRRRTVRMTDCNCDARALFGDQEITLAGASN